MRPLHKRKLIAGLVSAAGAAVLAMSSLTAGALAAPNPNEAQATNVPYVAWVGEHVRLVICEPELTEIADKAGVNIHSDQSFYGAFNANFAVEDWSGYQFQPPTPDGDAASAIGQYFDPGPAAFFLSSKGQVCVGTDYKSLNPGLTRIRLAVKSDSDGEIVYSHQFLVIWLTANKPVLNEAGTSASGTETFQNQLNGTGQSNLFNFLGDKAGDGKFFPSPFSGGETDKGLVQIKVTGSFPVISGTPLSNVLSEPTYTLPEAWPTLAETLASSSEETEPPGTNSGLWDIHETLNSSNEAEPGNDPLTADFYRGAFGNFTSGATATVGPYDPQSADETLLSDGTLNAEDAPMPALRIDVSLAPHTGGLTGVGEISGASKAQIYSHNFNGDAGEEGNLYNPYYGAYIPATDRGLPQSSGVTGPSPGGDFPGFLNSHPDPYTFWTSVKNANYRGGSHSTGCLRREGADPSEYETPSETPQTETFYTDERGEVYVTYTPGDGFYLENLPEFEGNEGESEEGKIIKNQDGGCDLKGLFGQEIGNSVISARAVYPYEPVDYSAQASVNTLTKTVTSAWEKEWFQFSKGPGSNENTVKIIVAKAQDIDGKPFVDETVCFVTPNGGTVSQFPGTNVKDPDELLGKGPDPVVGPSTVVSVGGTNEICEKTNDNGLASIEVKNSTLKKVDLNVEYVEEAIFRDHEVNFETPAEEKAEKAEKEAKEAAEKKAAAEKAANEAAAAEKAANEAAEKKANEERATEVAEKKITETEATEKAAAEKAANEAAEKAANEKRKTEVEAAKVTPVTVPLAAVTTTTTTTGAPAPLFTSAPALSLGTVSGSTASLTEAQKLAKALKACKKLPKSKRAKCEAQARKAHSAKNKKHKK